MIDRTYGAWSLALFYACLPSLGFASGYNFGTQSASAESIANASGAEASDASTIYFNPAGMSLLHGNHFTQVLDVILPSVSFHPQGQATANVGGQFVPIQGDSGGTPISTTVVPHAYLTHEINDRYSVGLGIFVPFAAKLAYDSNFVGRFYGTETSLETTTINPSLSIRLNDQNSVGIGLDAQYMFGALTRSIYGPSYAYGLSPSLAPAVSAADAQGAMDPYANIHGSNWGYGYNLGFLHSFNDDTRVGLAYRSAVRENLHARETLGNTTGLQSNLIMQGLPAALVHAAPTSAPAQVNVVTPESVSLNGWHRLNERWAVMADTTWTRHDRLQDLNILALPIANTSISLPWKNTWKASVGLSYQLSTAWQLRTGYMFDQSPTGANPGVFPTMPDNNRQWFSFGATYAINASNSIDLAVSYWKIDSRSLYRTYDNATQPDIPGNPSALSGTGSSQGQLGGRVDSSALALGLQWNATF